MPSARGFSPAFTLASSSCGITAWGRSLTDSTSTTGLFVASSSTSRSRSSSRVVRPRPGPQSRAHVAGLCAVLLRICIGLRRLGSSAPPLSASPGRGERFRDSHAPLGAVLIGFSVLSDSGRIHSSLYQPLNVRCPSPGARRRRLQNKSVELQAEALSVYSPRAPGLHSHRAVPPRVSLDCFRQR